MCAISPDGSPRKETKAVFGHFGLSPLTDPPGMYADHLLPPRRPLPAMQVLRVADQQTRLAFAHITSIAFDIPNTICRDIYGSEKAWAGSFQGYVGYADGLPVTTAATVITPEVVGVYSVATLPNYRRFGYAETTMRQAIQYAKERTGIQAAVLQSTATGLSLYEHIGFRKLTRFSVYIS